MMDLVNSVLNLVVPPASLVMLAFAWPTLTFISACEWLYNLFYGEEIMEDKVVVITGASSGIGEVQISEKRTVLVFIYIYRLQNIICLNCGMYVCGFVVSKVPVYALFTSIYLQYNHSKLHMSMQKGEPIWC